MRYLGYIYSIYISLIKLYTIRKKYIKYYLQDTYEVKNVKTLELEPLKKKCTIVIVEKEYDEPFWEYDSILLFSRIGSPLEVIMRPTLAFKEFLWELITKHRPDFVTEELVIQGKKEFYEDNPIAEICRERNVPLYKADMDENAKAYLAASLDERKRKRDEVIKTLARLSRKKSKRIEEIEYLTAYGQYLQYELEEEIKKIDFEVREAWVAMGILKRAKKTKKEKVMGIHLSSPRHTEGVTKLLGSMGVEVIPVKFEKRAIPTPEMKFFPVKVGKSGRAPELEVVPVVKAQAKELPSILFFLDTEKHVSSFDISMAYDTGFDIVVPYGGVGPEEARTIIQDAIFSREPKGLKRSCFLIGGKTLKETEEILAVAKQTMFPPFKTSVIIDPHGAYTTAAAIAAKVEQGVKRIGMEEHGLKAVVLAGTGPVGMATSALLAKLGYEVHLTSRSEEKAKKSADEVLERWKVKVEGVKVSNQQEALEVLKDASVVVATGALGTELVSKETLEELNGKKLMVDVNAVPPPGIAGMMPNHDMEELFDEIYGIGALVVGEFKNRVEKETMIAARSAGEGIFDLEHTFWKARELLTREERKIKLAPIRVAAS
ncbi:MAG: hypothetical protein AVW06_03720 [Hadesarchaea archaeon DG-33-1]|nr:MAG: hypothetical protein AVW06_03720 [Hadesarchaea archaeon DG-33-1]